ncbi:unnamed protein product [Leptosia nina]|uniref:DOMON domain-containing protein n=1 Tax=Leptosia nina TaxID=320188 RepID=A0AAV1IUM1_9NEOP
MTTLVLLKKRASRQSLVRSPHYGRQLFMRPRLAGPLWVTGVSTHFCVATRSIEIITAVYSLACFDRLQDVYLLYTGALELKMERMIEAELRSAIRRTGVRGEVGHRGGQRRLAARRQTGYGRRDPGHSESVIEDGEYMSFGISGAPDKSQMVGGDVAVSWLDKNSLKGYAEDYYLDAKSQCAGTHGSCPDERLAANTNSIRLLNAALVNGYSIVTYQRPLRASDHLDLPVLTNASQPIIWAIGPLNSRNEVSYHHHFTKSDRFVEFGRAPVWNCPMPENEDDATPTRSPVHEKPAEIKPNPVPAPAPVAKAVPWEIPGIQCYEPPDGVFYAQMGPTGGKQGYSAITGHVGWGISWYINGLLIPEITLVRGKKYTFVVEGGSDPEEPARFHPFYITNDPVGGYFHKSDTEKKGVEIYAGVRRARSGDLIPTGVGRLCNWTPDNEGPEADEYPSFGAYQRSLTLVCEEGNPGVVTWTPDKNTPDTVYYQCFTHRHLGWKINIVDECDATEAEESRVVESVALPSDLLGQESIQVQSRVKPDSNFLGERKKYEKIINTNKHYNDFSSDKHGGIAGELYPEPNRKLYSPGHEYELPISNGHIQDVIEAVESLEETMKNEFQRNATNPLAPQQYQVYEDVKESLVPEQPIRGDEYVIESESFPGTFMLPPNQKPQTLHAVMRPNSPNKQKGNMRPPFRRPSPPEIKLRRPHPAYPKSNSGYPLPVPNLHHSNGAPKKPNKYASRPPLNANRQQLPPNIPPMKAMPPLYSQKPNFGAHPMQKNGPKQSNSIGQSIIMGKPSYGVTLPSQSQTLSLGHTDLIANQVVKSQITLPGSNDAVSQQSAPQPTFSKQGQIILGKPMDHPISLDQHLAMITQQNVQPSSPTPEYHQPPATIKEKIVDNANGQSQTEVKSSDFIGQSKDPSSFAPAINTGFKPDSIVIESGFKPIIREPLMAAEDKIAEYESNANRREDTDVEEDYEESPQYINNNHAYSSEKLTETFEPMFIPSPPDHLLSSDDKTKEVFPKNHAKEDRPHPVYVKTESELNSLFSKKNIARDVLSDLLMESDRIRPSYLPPDPKIPKDHAQKLTYSGDETFTTYDGKTVSAATLTSIPNVNKTPAKLFSAKLPATTELLLKTPQFGPFMGEIPPQVIEHIVRRDSASTTVPVQDTRTTHLKLINPSHKQDWDLKAEGSDIKEVIGKIKSDKNTEKELEEYEEDAGDEEQTRNRRDTKTAQFERSEVEAEKAALERSNNQMNHVEFEEAALASGSAATVCRTALHIAFLIIWYNMP